MRTSAKWINEYLSSPATAHEQAELLTAVGFPCESSIALVGGDFAQEVETTSNRGDCLSHLGLAREVAAASQRTVRLPSVSAPRSEKSVSEAVTVANHDPVRCPRYTARVVVGIQVKPSPQWLQDRLLAIGQIPRNNVVDCTNFVLFEYGQPTHVFDLAKLHGRVLQVRAATRGEEFLPIGEGATSITLAGSELVIADANRPVALAGVKGGALTAVTAATTDVVIEAASFDPVAVRRSSRSLQIASDSSYRFERGVHPAEVDEAAERLVSLILETAGGTALAGSAVAGVPLPSPLRVELRIARLAAVAGFTIPSAEVMQILTVLGFAPEWVPSHDGQLISCIIPPRRLDVTREIDLIEEVVRLAGLDRVPMSETVSIRPVGPQPAVAAVRAAKNCLAGLGFVEAVCPTLVSERASGLFVGGDFTALRIADERALGEPVLRPSLLASLLHTLKLNQDRGAASLSLFEHAATFCVTRDGHRERRTLAIVAAGHTDGQDLYRFLRGSLERLVREMCGAHATMTICPVTSENSTTLAARALDPAGCICVDATAIGVVGLINATALDTAGLDAPVAAAELDWESLARSFPPTPSAHAFANSPCLDRDLSVILADTVSWSTLESTVRAANLPHLESITFVGTFRGKQVGADRKSVTFRMEFRALDRTLRREEVEPHLARLEGLLSSTLGATIRS